MTHTWILGHDLLKHSDRAAFEAAQELKWQKGSLVLLHVYQIPPTLLSFSGIQMETSYMNEAELAESIEKDAYQTLNKLAYQLNQKFPQIQIKVLLKKGDAAEVILNTAGELKADRIVVGSHGRSGLEHFFTGSVAEHVVRGSHIPVLVIKHQEE